MQDEARVGSVGSREAQEEVEDRVGCLTVANHENSLALVPVQDAS
jgi:hypothetical protein